MDVKKVEVTKWLKSNSGNQKFCEETIERISKIPFRVPEIERKHGRIRVIDRGCVTRGYRSKGYRYLERLAGS